MSQTQIINALLGVQGFEVMVEEVEIGCYPGRGGVGLVSQVVFPLGRSEGTRFHCSRCKVGYLWSYDYGPRRQVRDLSVFGHRCCLEFTPARVECPECGIHVEGFDWIEPRSRCTVRYERYVAELCEKMPAAEVARFEGLDKSTVYGIDKKWLARRHALREQLPIHDLGIDEIAILKGHKYMTLFYDLRRRQVVGGVMDRDISAVNQFFESFGPISCGHVKAVCTDFWSAYHNSVKKYLKEATLVFDKFHIFGYLTQAIDQVRLAEQKKAIAKDNGDHKLIQGSRWLWLKNRNKLKPEQSETLEEIMKMNENLQKAYLLKEDFSDLYTCQSREQAEVFLKEWVKRCKQSDLYPFKHFSYKLLRWKEGILNYFDHRITNAVAEGINNKVKVIKRRSYGFRDFEYFILKIMSVTGALPPLASIPHT